MKNSRTTPLRRPGDPERDLESLEHFLTHSLQPVQPRSAFRSGLQARLSKTPVPRYTPALVVQYVIVSLGGVAAAALVVVTAARLVMALWSSLGLLNQMRSPAK